MGSVRFGSGSAAFRAALIDSDVYPSLREQTRRFKHLESTRYRYQRIISRRDFDVNHHRYKTYPSDGRETALLT